MGKKNIFKIYQLSNESELQNLKHRLSKNKPDWKPVNNIFDNWDWSLTPNELRNTIRQACYKYFNENHSTIGKLFKKLEEPFRHTYNEK